MSFGNTLKEWMDKRGINAYELSEMTGVPAQTIYSMIKRNSKKADVEYIIRIAKALNVTVDELLGSDEEETYYFDDETAKAAQEIYDNPNLRILFDASRKASPEALKAAAALIELMEKEENGSDY